MVSSYRQAPEGKWILTHKCMAIACCDCGLVHLYRYKIVGNRLYRAVWRDNRRTAAVRRGKRFSGKWVRTGAI